MSSFKKDVFGLGGMLHRAFGDRYEVREPQVNMSVACANAVRERSILLAEGATGVGKSFAYLIASVSPSIRAARLESGDTGPLVISTSTKVLQDQIWQKDVPAILEATDQDLRVVLAKGRNNYVSMRRLSEFVKEVEDNKFQFTTAEDAEIGSRVAPELDQWIKASDGELATFDGDLPISIRMDIESRDDDCHGEACKYYEQCPYYRAKAKRKAADILVVNHALLALHLAYGRVLPEECSTFVIDEAHKFFDAASGVFETELRLRHIERFFRTFRNRLGKLRELVASNAVKISKLSDVLTKFEQRKSNDLVIAVDFFRDVQRTLEKKENRDGSRFGYATLTPEIDSSDLLSMLSEYTDACEGLADTFDVNLRNPGEDGVALALSILFRSAVEVLGKVKSVSNMEFPELWCYWSDVLMAEGNEVDSPYRITLKRTPIDITSQIVPLFDEDHAVIFTSATLQVAKGFDRIRGQLGLPKISNKYSVWVDSDTDEQLEDKHQPEGYFTEKDIIQKVYPSHFPYSENVEIHLFSNTILDRPAPSASVDQKEDYFAQQERLVEYYLRLRDGRALVLCSSQQLLCELYERLEGVFDDMGITALRQLGTDRLKRTFDDFKSDERSVLFGVASCWEGLDAPGTTLETVIVPQLPFAPPHPLLDARKALLTNPATEWFGEIMLPDMLLQLKQGAGRLVRSAKDKGVIAVLSPRPLTKMYGRDIQKALPPGKIVCNPVDALNFLQGEGDVKNQNRKEVDCHSNVRF